MLVVCSAGRRGEAKPVPFRMPGAPATTWATLLFLFGVLVLMAFDYPVGTWTIASVPAIAVVLAIGWKLARRKVRALHPSADHRRPVHRRSVLPSARG